MDYSQEKLRIFKFEQIHYKFTRHELDERLQGPVYSLFSAIICIYWVEGKLIRKRAKAIHEGNEINCGRPIGGNKLTQDMTYFEFI